MAGENGEEIKPRKLNELYTDAYSIEQILVESEGDISDEQAAEIMESWIAEFRAGSSSKIDAYIYVIRKTQAYARFQRDLAAELTTAAQAKENLADRLNQRLFDFMTNEKVERLTGGAMRIAIYGNGGLQPIEFDITKLPPEFVLQIPEANKEMIREELLAGKAVPGAALKERGKHLDFRQAKVKAEK